MEKIYDTIIIGGGPAGYSAALYCARNARSTLVIEKLSAGGQMATSPHIENYPGFDEAVDGFDLAEKMQHGAEHFGAETMYETVTKLELSGEIKTVETTGGILKSKTVLCAMGAYPRELGLKKEAQLRGKALLIVRLVMACCLKIKMSLLLAEEIVRLRMHYIFLKYVIMFILFIDVTVFVPAKYMKIS